MGKSKYNVADLQPTQLETPEISIQNCVATFSLGLKELNLQEIYEMQRQYYFGAQDGSQSVGRKQYKEGDACEGSSQLIQNCADPDGSRSALSHSLLEEPSAS